MRDQGEREKNMPSPPSEVAKVQKVRQNAPEMIRKPTDVVVASVSTLSANVRKYWQPAP